MRLYGKSYRHRKRLADISSRNNFSHPFRPKCMSTSAETDINFGRWRYAFRPKGNLHVASAPGQSKHSNDLVACGRHTRCCPLDTSLT